MFVRERDMTPIVTAWMRDQGMLVRPEQILCGCGRPDLVGCELSAKMVQRRLRREKPWRPLHARIIAVELKLLRVVDALHQAYNNLMAVEESYAAFPADVAARIVARRERWAKYWGHGIGLLSVNENCTVVIAAGPNREMRESMVERQVEKFFRERRKLGLEKRKEENDARV